MKLMSAINYIIYYNVKEMSGQQRKERRLDLRYRADKVQEAVRA